MMGSGGQKLAWTWLPVLLLGMTCSTHDSLVRVNKGLRVKRGQAAYLQEGDLQFDISCQKDACKLEVVLNEPITQQVGKLMPQVMEHSSNGNSSVSLVIYHIRFHSTCDSYHEAIDLTYFYCCNDDKTSVLGCCLLNYSS